MGVARCAVRWSSCAKPPAVTVRPKRSRSTVAIFARGTPSCVHQHDERDGARPEMHLGRADGIGGLERMTPLHPPTALRAAPDVTQSHSAIGSTAAGIPEITALA